MGSKPQTVQTDRGNEVAILAAVLKDPESSVATIRRVPAHQFLVAEHQAIWTVYREAVNRNHWMDRNWITRQLQAVGDKHASFFKHLFDQPAKPESLADLIGTLDWDAKRFHAFENTLPELVSALASAASEPARVQALARRLSDGLKHRGTEIIGPEQLVRDYQSKLTERATRDHGVWGIGLPGFDDALGLGFAPGGTSVVAGVSGAGKTSVLLGWAMQFAKLGRRVAYFALEEDVTALMDTVVSAHTGIDVTKIVQGKLSPEEKRTCVAAARYYSKWITFIDNPFVDMYLSSGSSGKKLRNVDHIQVLAGFVAETGADVVIYDLWERAIVEGDPFSVGKALEITQRLHVVFGVHGIIAAQVNVKDMEKGTNFRAQRGDIKGVSKLVEVAHQIFMVERPGILDDGIEDKTTITTIWKQKVGKWPIRIAWDWEGCYKRVVNPRIETEAVSMMDIDDDDLAASML
jgi:hypothetical protein